MTIPALRRLTDAAPYPADAPYTIADLHRDDADWWAELVLPDGEHVLAVVDFDVDGVRVIGPGVDSGDVAEALTEVCERKWGAYWPDWWPWPPRTDNAGPAAGKE